MHTVMFVCFSCKSSRVLLDFACILHWAWHILAKPVRTTSIEGGFEYSQRKIRLSTVKVHGVEPSVIVKQNVLRDFTTREKKKKRWNK